MLGRARLSLNAESLFGEDDVPPYYRARMLVQAGCAELEHGARRRDIGGAPIAVVRRCGGQWRASAYRLRQR